MNKYAKLNDEFVKLTIRVKKSDLDKFKKLSEIMGTSANNQINILIRTFNYKNKGIIESDIDFWDEVNQPK